MRKLFLFALCLLGLFDSLYLLWAYAFSSRPMVCVGGGCDVVRASSYAHFAGLPLPAYGAAMYTVLAILAFGEPLFPAAKARVARGVLAAIAIAGFLVSAYLTGVEDLVLHAWCAWCIVSAVTIALILLLAVLEAFHLARRPVDPSTRLAGMQKNLAVVLGAIVLGVPSFVYLTRQDRLPPPSPPPPKTLDARLVRPGTHFYGDPKARVTVVEFGDFECPYCGQEEKTAREIRQKFAGKIRFAFRQLPLTSIHPYAEKAAEASECAARQGKFWPAVDFLYTHQSDLTLPALHRYAAELSLNQTEFDRCLDSGEMAERVHLDQEDGQALHVSRVPTFFIGHTMVEGAIDAARFSSLIEKQLAEESAAAPAPSPESRRKPASEPRAARLKPPAPTGTPNSGVAAEPLLGQSETNVFTKLNASPTGCSEEEAKLKQPTLIGTAEAHKLFDERAQTLFVDVRKPGEFKSEHIPGALDVPIDEFELRAKGLPKNKTLILYESGRASGDICAASRAAGRILLSEGFPSSHVRVYQEGLAGWQKAGLPVTR
jgi:protein-disulfide isomerase/rhodanese-related sulfurtransferase